MKDFFHKCQARFVTLLEIIIAMILTSIVLMALMYFYEDVVHIGANVDKMREEEFYLRYVENRLINTVALAVPKKDTSANDAVFFSTNDASIAMPGSQTLIFMFDNDISLDKDFSNHVLGRLYVDPEGKLTLAYWPSPKRLKLGQEAIPMKKEILFQDASSLAFEFFIAPEKASPKKTTGKQGKDEGDGSAQTKINDSSSKQNLLPQPQEANKEGQNPEPKGEWTVQPWSKDYNQLPVLIKIIVPLKKEAAAKYGQEKLVFVFPLVFTEAHIVYD